MLASVASRNALFVVSGLTAGLHAMAAFERTVLATPGTSDRPDRVRRGLTLSPSPPPPASECGGICACVCCAAGSGAHAAAADALCAPGAV
jgi:hypothetical protein